MNVTAWHEEPIGKKHDRDAFDCGDEALNGFLRRYARKSHELGGAKTFLAVSDAADKAILGFYSLCRRRLNILEPRRPRGEDWPAMMCRASAWRGWPWIASSRDSDSAGNFCSQPAAGAFLPLPR